MVENVDNTDDLIVDDELAKLPPDRLAQMLRDKRKAEASLRGRLRDTEGERDTLAGAVSGYQENALNDLATQAGAAPTALDDLRGHLPLDQLMGEDGNLDTEKVSEALATLKGARPHLFIQSGATVASGVGSFTSGDDTTATPTWGDVIGG